MKMAELLPLTPTALRKAKIVYNFGLSECSRVIVYHIFTMVILISCAERIKFCCTGVFFTHNN